MEIHGVGKTTVARIIGKIFAEENVLSDNEKFIEIHARDLIAQYVGWTAKQTKEIIKKAKGGVLFIDEAYSLNTIREGSFEKEAIATLIKEMEDNREDICIILAGYTKEMQELMKVNSGLESRIQFHIQFPDYTEEELFCIFKKMLKQDNYTLSNNVKELLTGYFIKEKKKENFANGRCVRNLFEKIKFEQANRIGEKTNEDINLIKRCDIENVLLKLEETKEKTIIGFAS